MNILVNIIILRSVRKIYNISNKFFYEIIEDYKEGNLIIRNEILQSFTASIWSSSNKRRIYKKTINFKVRGDLIHSELGQVFDMWSEVEYTGYKSMTDKTDYISLIRQKINNLYTRFFDSEVILHSEYMNLLNTPKRLYYRWISGEKFSKNYVTVTIDDAINKSIEVKEKYRKQKMSLSWTDYKALIKDLLMKIFQNCILLDDYSNVFTQDMNIDNWNEDNFYIKYVCKYLENELKQYQKKYYGVKQHKIYGRCKECGDMFEKTGRNHIYCNGCKRIKQLEWQKKSMREYRKSLCEVL